MRIHCTLLFATLMISWLARASCLSNSSYNLLSGQRTNACPSDGTPVCGLQDKQLVLFSNECLLNAANKDIWPGETIFRKIPLQNCTEGCRFSCRKVYKPVCTKDKRTLRTHLFRNQCELSKNICEKNIDYFQISLDECVPKVEPQKINKKLQKRSEATERRRRPVPCTNVFKPVCGSYLGVKSSFKNECILNAENVAFGRDWRIVKYGMCPEDLPKTRRRKDKPAKQHTITKRNYNNILINRYPTGSLDANNNNELNVSPNDLYFYVPSTFQHEFLNHDSSNYHALTENEVYDDYLQKVRTLTPFDMSFNQPEETIERTDVLHSAETIISSLPFSVNRMNLNYVVNKNLAHEINQQASFAGTEANNDETQKQIYYGFKRVEATSIKNEYLNEMPTTLYTPTETAETLGVTSAITMSSKNMSKQIKREESAKAYNECNFGAVAICATLANGTLQTFETLCEMMKANAYSEKTWVKLHEGSCDDCKYKCSQEYKPVCVSKNGVNYTMINECYYNMGICLDKKSKWQILSNKECYRYTRVLKKYSDTKPVYNLSETTEPTSTDIIPKVTLSKLLKAKPSKTRSRKRKGNTKREISRFGDNNRCCTGSHLSKQFSENIQKCKCWSDSTQEPLPFQESQTESYIMSLVRENDT